MDQRYFESVGTIRGGDSLEVWINAGILEQKLGGIRKMPLEYATPLTEREITHLKEWANKSAPE